VHSSVDLTKDNILRADDGDHVGKHVTAHHFVERRQVRKTRRAEFQPVRLVGAV
jgi:hypothetical protein